MELDIVHDIQAAYRKVVDCMSRPGSIGNISEQAGRMDIKTGCFSATAILALMLLDAEVTFKVYSEREAEVSKLLNQLTYAKTAETKEADFIFVLQDAGPSDLETALRAAKTGDLADPQKSATVIVEADELKAEGRLRLRGPGIEAEGSVGIHPIFKSEWIDLRSKKNCEYPLGIDLIFTDWEDNVLCLARTTQIERQVVG